MPGRRAFPLLSTTTVINMTCKKSTTKEAISTIKEMYTTTKLLSLVLVLGMKKHVRLVELLCNEHNIKLLKLEDKQELGESVGLCKIDKAGKPGKVVKFRCIVIK